MIVIKLSHDIFIISVSDDGVGDAGDDDDDNVVCWWCCNCCIGMQQQPCINMVHFKFTNSHAKR